MDEKPEALCGKCKDRGYSTQVRTFSCDKYEFFVLCNCEAAKKIPECRDCMGPVFSEKRITSKVSICPSCLADYI